jgi:hypothetical protein
MISRSIRQRALTCILFLASCNGVPPSRFILIAHGYIHQEKKSEIVQAHRHPPDADKFLVLLNARRRF